MNRLALLVFDEGVKFAIKLYKFFLAKFPAHHCYGNHAANRIMQEFYHSHAVKTADNVPAILGLTASPVVKQKSESLK